MDFGGCDRRKTKKDLKRKRLARGYKRGGQFRTANVTMQEEDMDDAGKKSNKKKKSRKRKF